MQACGRLVARLGEQDVDRDTGAGIEVNGGVMAPVMGDLDDPALDASGRRSGCAAGISSVATRMLLRCT